MGRRRDGGRCEAVGFSGMDDDDRDAATVAPAGRMKATAEQDRKSVV